MATTPIVYREQPEAEVAMLRQRVALLEQRTRELTALNAVAAAASQVTDLDELLNQALDAVLNAVAIPELRPMGGVFLIDHATGLMHLATQRGLHPEFVAQERCVPVGECLCGFVGKRGRTLVSLNNCHDPLHTRQWSQSTPHGHIIAPLTARGRTLGVLFLYLNPDHTPDPSYVELVTAIGLQLGMAVEQAQLYQQLQASLAQVRSTSRELAARNDQLERRNRELRVTHELALAMHSSADLADVQERLLALVTSELGYERAILAMVDHRAESLSGWLCSARHPGGLLQRLPHTARLALGSGKGPLIEAICSTQPLLIADGQAPTSDAQLNQWLGLEAYLVLPMVLRQQPIGLLIVDNPHSQRPLSPDDLVLLSNISRQASVVLGGVQLCIDRAQRLAVEEERSRIAMEVHDSISQQLYGLTYTLDACVDLLPTQPDVVREQLVQLVPYAQQANAAIRRAIFDLWPEELDRERFVHELRGYLDDLAPASALQLQFEVASGFDQLPNMARKQLYRIAQEALNNVLKHAGAHHATLTVTVEPAQITMRVEDDGRGFDLRHVPDGQVGYEHLGLTSMRERASALGGQLHVQSQPGRGTTITVVIPRGC
ncbi:MAG: GAF domain-containing protein [Chloroflexi bacterium OHK40]